MKKLIMLNCNEEKTYVANPKSGFGILVDGNKATVISSVAEIEEIIYLARSTHTDSMKKLYYTLIHYNKKLGRYYMEIIDNNGSYIVRYEITEIKLSRGKGIMFFGKERKMMTLQFESPIDKKERPCLFIPHNKNGKHIPTLFYKNIGKGIPQKILYEGKMPESFMKSLRYENYAKPITFSDLI